MKKRLLTAAAVGAFLALPSVAAAQEGWYVRGALGYGAPGDAGVSGNLNGDISGESNFREALGLGYQWANGFRLDTELAHRFNQTGAVGNFENSYSSVHGWSLMLTGIYEFNQGGFYRPYIGAGIGAVNSTFSAGGWNTGTRTAASVYRTVRGDDWAMGYQALAGVAWTLTERLTLDTEYRYFGYSPTSYTPNTRVERLEGHEAWIGLRYALS
ncbi:MAG: outer membrane protein, partial [Caulobacterales bacterium]|uniref:outer membrane protein n=1 Tax=Glycocaulis sp. TaxID=1969725 RepID=UPI003FA02416